MDHPPGGRGQPQRLADPVLASGRDVHLQRIDDPETGKGIDLEVLFSGTGYALEFTTRIQDQLVGVFPEIKIKQKSVESALFSTNLADGKFQLTTYTNTVVPDAVLEMTSQYHSEGSRNYGRGNFPEIDALLEKAIGEVVAQAIAAFFAEERNAEVLDRLKEGGLDPEPPPAKKVGNLSGKTFVVTGTLAGCFDKIKSKVPTKAGRHKIAEHTNALRYKNNILARDLRAVRRPS